MAEIALTNAGSQNINKHMELFTAGVVQEHPMGCAVACVAYRCGITYEQALTTFLAPEHAWTRGFYCEEVVSALAELQHRYSFSRYHPEEHEKFLNIPGTIIFVDPCERYPSGHFLARGLNQWMNPWSTFPKMTPVEFEFQSGLPGPIGYVIFENP